MLHGTGDISQDDGHSTASPVDDIENVHFSPDPTPEESTHRDEESAVLSAESSPERQENEIVPAQSNKISAEERARAEERVRKLLEEHQGTAWAPPTDPKYLAAIAERERRYNEMIRAESNPERQENKVIPTESSRGRQENKATPTESNPGRQTVAVDIVEDLTPERQAVELNILRQENVVIRAESSRERQENEVIPTESNPERQENEVIIPTESCPEHQAVDVPPSVSPTPNNPQRTFTDAEKNVRAKIVQEHLMFGDPLGMANLHNEPPVGILPPAGVGEWNDIQKLF